MPLDEERLDELLDTHLRELEADNPLAERFLFELAAKLVEKGEPLPQRLREFFSRVVMNPELYLTVTGAKPVKSPGRPSADRMTSLDRIGLGALQPFGTRNTECNALAIHYLLSIGHTLNEAGTPEKESAVTIISRLTGRSPRSLQADYAKHKPRIVQEGAHADLGELQYLKLRSLAELRQQRST